MVERIKLVASDLDCTLIQGESVSPRTRAALDAMRAAGVTLVLATSRRWTGTVPIARQIDFAGTLVLYDGALIREYPSGKELHRETLAPEQSQVGVELLASHGLQPIAQFSNADGEYFRYVPDGPHQEWTADYLSRYASQAHAAPLAQVAGDGRADGGVLRVVAFGPVPVLRRAAVAVAHLHITHQLLLMGSYGEAELTLFPRTASKGAAVRRVAEAYGVPLGSVLAIGDGMNDISMLREAGLGVAMGNAPRRVRAAADVVTTTIAEDGAAHAFERYVLGREEVLPRL